ncbi:MULTISPECIES: hypothetical protein [unclassified Endozoicomonas]|uniref:hypothetical protein n=1 Tax=unclassified Endozoicomonas TaxID=2644528 RepID=UPI003BB55C62
MKPETMNPGLQCATCITRMNATFKAGMERYQQHSGDRTMKKQKNARKHSPSAVLKLMQGPMFRQRREELKNR